MKVLILLGFITFACAEVDQLDCSIKGPQYWCKNEETAKECLAVSYCNEYVWKKENVLNADKCSTCQQFVGTIHMLLMNKETQSQVILAFKAACNLLPSLLKPVCTEMLNLESSEVIDYVLKYTKDPRHFCILLGMCTHSSKPAGIENFLLVKKAIVDKLYGDYCIPCKEYMSGLHSMTSSEKAKSDLVNAMKGMCRVLPKGVSTFCPSVVDHLGEQIVDSIFEYTSDPSRFCAAVGLCMDRDRPVNQVPESVASSIVEKPDYIKFTPENPLNADACTYCKEYVNVVHTFISKEKSQEMVLSVMINACNLLQSPLKEICTDAVKKDGKTIIAMLVTYTTDPNLICTMIHLCSSGSNEVVFGKMIVDKSPNAEVCTICQQVIGTIHMLVLNKQTQAMITSEITAACKYLPSADQPICEAAVKIYAPSIIKMILKYTKDPRPICQMLHLCPQGKVVIKINIKSSNDVCSTCKVAVGTIDKFLVSHKAIIIAGIGMACHLLPPSTRSLCKTFAPEIFNYLVDCMKDPVKLCTMLHLCSGNKKLELNNLQFLKMNKAEDKEVIRMQFVKVKGLGSSCAMCQSVFRKLYLSLNNETTQKDVKQTLLLLVCPMIKSELARNKCVALLTNYFDEFWNVMLSVLKGHLRSCKVMHLCATASKKVFYHNGEICKYCVQGVTYMEAFLKCNKTRDYVISATHKACERLPYEYQKVCNALVSKYVGAAFDCLIKDMKTPKEVCTEMHLCASSQFVPVIEVNAGAECEFCKYAAQGLHAILNSTQAQEKVKSLLLDFCHDKPAFIGNLCTSLVVQYFDSAIKFIVEKLGNPKEVCEELKLCSPSGMIKEEKSMKVNGVVTCEVCEILIRNLDNMLKGNRTKKVVKEALNKLCVNLPWSQQCSDLVSKYSDRIIDLLVIELKKTEEVCKALGLCQSIVKVPLQDVSKTHRGGTKKEKSVKVNSSVACEICVFFMEKLKTMMKGNRTTEVVREALDKLCADLPLSSECIELVNKYAGQIVNFLVLELKDPEEVCKALGLCLSTVKVSLQDVSQTQEKNGFLQCEVCTMSMDFLIQEAKGVFKEKVVKDILERLCQLIPDKEKKTQCVYLVNKYTREIIEMATKGFDGAYICKKIGYCDSSRLTLNGITHNNDKQMEIFNNKLPTCNLCMFMTGKLDSLLKKNVGKKMIKGIIKSICLKTKLTKDEEGDCQRLMDENRHMIMKLVKNMKLPSLCKRIGHCVSRHTVNRVPTSLEGLHKVKYGGYTCTACEYLIGVLDSTLSQQSVKSKIIDDVHNLCDKLPRQIFVTECNVLISEYGKEIIQLFIDNVLAPVDICQHFGLC